MDPQVPQPSSTPVIPTHTTSKLPLIIGIILLHVVAVSGAYYFGYDHGFEKSAKQEIATPSPTSVVQTNETTNWKTYTNEKYGFSIKYPQDARINDTFDPRDNKPASYLVDVLLSHEGPAAFPLLKIEVFDNLQLLSAKDYFTEQYRSNVEYTKTHDVPPVATVVNERQVKIGTVTSYAVIFDPNNSVPRNTTYIPKENKMFTITYPLDSTAANDPNAEEHIQTFNQMLSTFKFNDKRQPEITNLQNHTGKYFSVSYPNTWYEWSFGRGVDLDYYQINSIPESQQESNNASYISFDIQGMDYTESKTIEEQKEIVEDLQRKYPEWNYIISEQVVNGQKALAYEKTIENNPAYEKKIWLVKNNVKYIITWTVQAQTVQERNKLTSLYKTDFDKIISTFEFTK